MNTFKPSFNSPFSEALDKAVTDLIRKQNIACDELTEKQLGEAIKQAIACGDFQRQVRASDNALTVIYIPYREYEILKTHYEELIMAVAQKYEGETRHETALRYIREREERCVDPQTYEAKC